MKKIMLAWSSGKDSAWALHVLREKKEFEVVGLFTTINQEFDRVAMHAVRTVLTRQQADRAGLPLSIIPLPHPCSNNDYEAIMRDFTETVKAQGIHGLAFGDLFLEDVRRYREKNLAGTGLEGLFPLWGEDTKKLSGKMIQAGLRAYVTCVDTKQLPASLSGREYNPAFLSSLPETADPCGENGEFHTFVFAGPMLKNPIPAKIGETTLREGFAFTDVLPASNPVPAPAG